MTSFIHLPLSHDGADPAPLMDEEEWTHPTPEQEALFRKFHPTYPATGQVPYVTYQISINVKQRRILEAACKLYAQQPDNPDAAYAQGLAEMLSTEGEYPLVPYALNGLTL